MRIMRLMLAAVFAVLAFGAMATSSALAIHPLFLTQSGLTLLFTGLAKDPLLRGTQAGLTATILCEKLLIHGFILHKSTLAHLLGLLFEGKCVQRIGTGAAESCEETGVETKHITTKPILAELGLLNAGTSGSSLHVVILLAPDDGTTNFATLKCGGHETNVGGVIVGEIPALNEGGEKQINEARESLEIVFATVNKTSQQAITEIFLLGSLMEKQELKVEGFLGEKASEEANATLKPDGLVTICTH